MRDLNIPTYDVIRNFVKKLRVDSWDWNDIKTLEKKGGFQYVIDNNMLLAGWPELSYEEYCEIVRLQKEAEDDNIRLVEQSGMATIFDGDQNNGVSVPTDARSCWQCYKRGLLGKGWKENSVKEIELASIHILKNLTDRPELSPIKGMVIGNVQSGKTANMAALMAMAADYGWNMFIILAGTIENLRNQTSQRLFNDLTSIKPNLSWRLYEHLTKRNCPQGQRAQDLNFSSDSFDRHFTVCLKNARRLEGLIDWLHADKNSMRQMKVLVIDDEADQASINTADISIQERNKINRLICNLVNGNKKKYNGDSIERPFASMNYIGYTATPYANVLNESPGYSLYPEKFISTLGVSKEYFGPQQIFGISDGKYDGLDIIRKVETHEVETIKSIHQDGSGNMPSSMSNALCWFLCGISCMRYWGYSKPISMLVHTSQRTEHHDKIYNLISSWLVNTRKELLIEKCRKIWEAESNRFTISAFREQYSDYARFNNEIKSLPPFDDIIKELEILLNAGVTHIKLDDNDGSNLKYNAGIHCCIDNCTKNQNDGEYHLRLVYPNEKEMPSPAPAFLVIGGSTLSRGLTIEGLISTYFLRSVGQADTLMQMGRWFGYRRGYELIPRIWMTSKTISQFEFLSELDEELRKEIHMMDVNGIRPIDYGPKVLSSPKASFIRITANNRMQGAIETEVDYGGSFNQTYLFDNDYDILNGNLEHTRNFINSLGEPEKCKPCNEHAKNAKIWRNQPFNSIGDFLSQLKYQNRQAVFSQIESLITWVGNVTENNGLNNWNVVLAGKNQTEDQKIWVFEHGVIGKVTRSQKINNEIEGILNIGVLRATRDILADVDLENLPQKTKDKVRNFDYKNVREIRDEAGLGNVPQLIIYIIDKDSGAKVGSTTRKNLNAQADIVGICLNIPSIAGNNYRARIAIQIDGNNIWGNLDIED